MRILDGERLSALRLRDVPFEWARIEHSFRSEDIAKAVSDTFPSGLLREVVSAPGVPGKDKSYRMSTTTLFLDGHPPESDDLPEVWRDLLSDVTSSEYRDLVTRATNVDVRSCATEVRLCEYPPEGWLSPHTDREDKMVTQVLYLNDRWDARWGGHLSILNSSDASDVHTTVLPALGTSVLFVRSDESWHSVARVDREVQRGRRSLLVHFTRSDAEDESQQ